MNQNMNGNMNEQDLILKKKIEKREKIDTILAYILIIILLGAIIAVLYLKFIREEDEVTPPTEYVPKYISLNEISNSLNTSTLASGYLADKASFSSSIMDDELVINYTKEDTNITLNASVVGNELMLNISNENTDIVTDIYKEIASIICVYYGNDVNACNNVLGSVNSDNAVDGIRYVSGNNTNNVYIDMTKSIDVNAMMEYNTVTKTSIDNTNYTLSLLDTKISNINISNGDNTIIVSGNINRLNNDTENVSIIVKLYDKDNNLIDETNYDFNENNVLETSGKFTVTFLFEDASRMSAVDSYSIEIVK